MALPHAVPGQVIGVAPLGPLLKGSRTHALFKSRDLEVMRLVLGAGDALPPHRVPGEVTIHCIEGRCEVRLAAGVVALAPGELLLIGANEVHGVAAVSDCSALVTLVLKPSTHLDAVEP